MYFEHLQVECLSKSSLEYAYIKNNIFLFSGNLFQELIIMNYKVFLRKMNNKITSNNL